jgi:uracil-DNA glycosylase family 4
MLIPAHDCPLCPRLCSFREQNREKFPDKHNGPVPPFGSLDAELLIIGLAPGLKGANFSGRPFTGDFAGELLYSTLIKYGFAKGVFKARPDDGLELVNCRITNAVRCVPPENKPTPEEMKTCLPFLTTEIAAMKNLKSILVLGLISHQSTFRALGQKPSAYKFAHNALHRLPSGIAIHDSYHCSRYNTQTGRLTEAMFHEVFDKIRKVVP